VIEQELKGLGDSADAAPTAPAKPATDPPKDLINLDDFKKVDLRVATVLAAERVPRSDKLLKLQVEVGTDRRQVVAGIAQHYAPENLIGKSIIVVYNLHPAKLMGQESQGMLLAASDAAGRLVIVQPAGTIDSGSKVK
jgi:methionyl-tRNA synthetase